MLEQLGLVGDADRLARTYSGGMRRRLDLGASLVGAPRLLLLDEPTTVSTRAAGSSCGRRSARSYDGTDVLLTTQYLDEADHLASQVVIIDHGRSVATGSPAELNVRSAATSSSSTSATVATSHGSPRCSERLDHGETQIDEPTRRVSVRVGPVARG